MLLRKEEFVRAMKKYTGVTLADGKFIYDVFCDTLLEVFAEGNDVSLKNVGTLYIKDKPAHKSFNPRDQVWIDVPPRKLLRFKEATGIRDYLAGKRDSFKRFGENIQPDGLTYDEEEEIEDDE